VEGDFEKSKMQCITNFCFILTINLMTVLTAETNFPIWINLRITYEKITLIKNKYTHLVFSFFKSLMPKYIWLYTNHIINKFYNVVITVAAVDKSV